ncbi:MAG TPA: maltose alpha-D-glucosyltransferase [Anaerolineales bacterium]|nr:maltose alpha-D-glucosyltransferase [Anaerolineales bacterium]
MSAESLWYLNAVFYELNVRAFFDHNGNGHGDLRGLTTKLDYLQDLGVDAIWLLPIYPSPLLDDGYDIADYYSIHPDYGDLEDFKSLLNAAHQRGMKVITDLVLNHTSDQHRWFQSARQGRDNPYHDYYVWSDDDQKYAQARIIFLDTEKSNWTWDESARRFYWHRFYSSQPDLNYDNPAVREEMLNIAKFWLDQGVDGFRADAVPYLFERESTNCENLPETHAYLKELRHFIDQNYPGRILLCEANQWPQDVRQYFGNGDEFHMGFHFPLMPRIFMALRKSDIQPLEWAMEQTPPIPDNTQWCIFLRNHDELTLEMVTEAERQWMWEQYAKDPRMRLNLGIRRRLAPLLDNDRRQIELAYSMLFTLPGSPILYYGDEIGMGDNIWLPDRNGVRTPMQWDNSQQAGFSTAPAKRLYAPVVSTPGYEPTNTNVADQLNDPGSLLNTIKHMINARKSHSALGTGEFSWVPNLPSNKPNPVAAYLRVDHQEKVFIIQNLSPNRQNFRFTLPVSAAADLILGNSDFSIENELLSADLDPYGYMWVHIKE